MATNKKVEPIVIKDMSATAFARLLKKLRACPPAKQYAEGKTLKQAWRYARYGSWMMWLLEHVHNHFDTKTGTYKSIKNADKNFGTYDQYLKVYYAQPDTYGDFAKRDLERAKFFRKHYVVR